ncbi:hypothetical protein C1659_24905 [Klebsiella pneumoniae]|nr:hypothetical protein C1659_24905 [Klebsiella pneumoniae]
MSFITCSFSSTSLTIQVINGFFICMKKRNNLNVVHSLYSFFFIIKYHIESVKIKFNSFNKRFTCFFLFF